MIKFKHFNKEGIKKAGSIALVTTILTTGICTFSGCGKQDKNNDIKNNNTKETQVSSINKDRKNYAVVVEDNKAIIYEGIEIIDFSGTIRAYINFDEQTTIYLPLGETHIFDNVSLEEVEEYARMFLTENGKIEYYNVEGKGKTLTRTKDNS